MTASDAALGDLFGLGIGLSGDRLLIGAYRDDHAGGVDAGAAYLFIRSGKQWTEEAKLVASDAAENDQFGWAVAVSGNTTVVGAFEADLPGALDAGSAYVFDLNCYQGGDLNCDGKLDAFDIDPFVLALTAPSEYVKKYPDCDWMLADINEDGFADAFDIDPFVALLIGG